jgi:hypothetical protein
MGLSGIAFVSAAVRLQQLTAERKRELAARNRRPISYLLPLLAASNEYVGSASSHFTSPEGP